MKKWIWLIMILLLCGVLAIPALAAPEGPVITMQPQSPNYPEYSVATYTVKATGTNLTATWYIEYEGKTYNASQIGGEMQPWEAYAGETYGATQPDANTFCFVFSGIGSELSGAEIWCELEDGHYDIVSQVGHITVGDYGTPPEILDIPASVTVKQGEQAEIRCVAKSGDGSQLNFLWYETGTGKFQDMQAINRGEETGDYMFLDTSAPGTCYYVCGITTTGGGMAYSSMVEVTVVENTANPPAETTPVATGSSQPETTPVSANTTEPTEATEAISTKPTQNQNTNPTTPATESAATAATIATRQEDGAGQRLSWWVLVLVGIAAAGVGVAAGIILSKKNRKGS